ncbi:hypothetical protein M3M33_15080, partial [Loigolactobacillus coryniformis]|uniref:hypothetical protein n=1 Tax=Loigolactobacillus coryniformis TaxID=1610 RepID=UPI00201AB55E
RRSDRDRAQDIDIGLQNIGVSYQPTVGDAARNLDVRECAVSQVESRVLTGQVALESRNVRRRRETNPSHIVGMKPNSSVG